ncbi:MAG TPA: outer membrane protein transport protein [Steroidobacteraceae bacterium]|nr:outer membrane protein transport protein [Steroidobacteraceae bacterium]
MRRLIQHRVAILALLISFASTAAYSAGFALLEQSSSRLGTAFSGTAAAADDATTLYFNPAGLMHLKGNNIAASLSGVSINSEFSNSGSTSALGQPLGNAGGDAGGMNYVPSAYWASKFTDRFGFGVGVNAPFGLKLEYDNSWLGRYQARRSEIKTLNINPAFAFRINEYVTLAVGADYQRLQAELSSAVNYTAVIASQVPAATAANLGLEGHTVVSGEDWGWGFNIGALFDITNDARIGVAYRSPITYDVTGIVIFTAPTATNPTGAAIIAAVSAPGAPLSNGAVQVSLKVPGSATVSYWQKVTPRVELLADVAWTQWSSIEELRVLRSSGATLSVTPENWRDTWRGAFGMAFAVNSGWKLRAGVAYDQTPVPDSTRTPRLPDADRTWIALGAGWSPTEFTTVDFGYAHLFASDVSVNQNAGSTPAYGLINGQQSNAIEIFTAQFAYRF